VLPTELLQHRFQGEQILPKQLVLNDVNLSVASELIQIFQSSVRLSRKQIQTDLQILEGDSTDYRLKRGLAHLLETAYSLFEIQSPLPPLELRQRLFRYSAIACPHPQSTSERLSSLAVELTKELGSEITEQQIQQGVYADLKENQLLMQFEAPAPETLLHRYNLAQVQGIFYRASEIKIQAHRNDPGEYKLLFRYLKLFGLMAYIEGDADYGFSLMIDGPASLFQSSPKYGLALAKLLPALLHVSRWSLTAVLQTTDSYSRQSVTRQYSLDSSCSLVSHYPPGKPYDSLLEAGFVERWTKVTTEWKLEREVDLIPIPGSVMIPDFRLVHPDGRIALLEIVGYWRPAYLQKKFAQVRKAKLPNLILAISERLNLEKAGVNLHSLPAEVVWFKDKLPPKAVLLALESIPPLRKT
jgi:uncharacterized protein